MQIRWEHRFWAGWLLLVLLMHKEEKKGRERRKEVAFSNYYIISLTKTARLKERKAVHTITSPLPYIVKYITRVFILLDWGLSEVHLAPKAEAVARSSCPEYQNICEILYSPQTASCPESE